MDKLEKEIREELEEKIEKIDKEIKEIKRNRIKGVLEGFAFALVDFNTSDEYKGAMKIALDKLEEI